MGQRSQIYVRYRDGEKIKLAARYFQWNFAERMVSRARYTVAYLQKTLQFPWELERKLVHIIETNFDFVDVVLSENVFSLIDEYRENVFCDIDNNDGKLFIDCLEEGKIKYCFTDCDASKPLNGDEYMDFDTEGCYEQFQWKNTKEKDKKTVRNIKWLEKYAELMNAQELQDFINCKYEAV